MPGEHCPDYRSVGLLWLDPQDKHLGIATNIKVLSDKPTHVQVILRIL